jgi:hypothetical protein
MSDEQHTSPDIRVGGVTFLVQIEDKGNLSGFEHASRHHAPHLPLSKKNDDTQ